MKGKWRKMENRGISWGIKGVKMKVSFEVEGGEKWILRQYFLNEINRISKFKMGTAVKI